MRQHTKASDAALQCWLICTSRDNFQIDRQNNFSVEGFKARNKRLASEVRPGDRFVVDKYLPDYEPKTCGRFECLQEARKRGIL